MATIDSQDVLYATLTQLGNEVAVFKISGMSSMNEALRVIRTKFSKCKGLVTLRLRNYTKGWTQIRQLMILKPVTTDAIQLTLFE